LTNLDRPGDDLMAERRHYLSCGIETLGPLVGD
jgi:hypothetical protein